MIDNYMQTTGFGAFGLRSSSVKKEWKRSQYEDEHMLYIASVKRQSSSGYHHTSMFELATSRLTQLAESSA
jgi:hypothetical protein